MSVRHYVCRPRIFFYRFFVFPVFLLSSFWQYRALKSEWKLVTFVSKPVAKPANYIPHSVARSNMLYNITDQIFYNSLYKKITRLVVSQWVFRESNVILAVVYIIFGVSEKPSTSLGAKTALWMRFCFSVVLFALVDTSSSLKGQ